MYKHFFKRLIDFLIVLTALLVIWPFLLIIYIWLTIANKGAGAIFYQERPGLNGKIFKVMKFKSMPNNEDLEAMVSVDNFILTAVQDGINYCNRGSWVGMGACVDVIADLVNDRFRCGPWFKNQEYIKARLTSNRIYVEIKDLEARITTIQERGAALLSKYDDPRFKAQRQSIENESQNHVTV